MVVEQAGDIESDMDTSWEKQEISTQNCTLMRKLRDIRSELGASWESKRDQLRIAH